MTTRTIVLQAHHTHALLQRPCVEVRHPITPQPTMGVKGKLPQATFASETGIVKYAVLLRELKRYTPLLLSNLCQWKVSSELAVLEEWAPVAGREDTLTLPEHSGGKDPDAIVYRADERPSNGITDMNDPRWDPGVVFSVKKWFSARSMPIWASRTRVRVNAIRIEQVRDIWEVMAEHEGFRSESGGRFDPGCSAVGLFAAEWERRYPGSWERNDWVWVPVLETVSSTRKVPDRIGRLV